MTGLVLEDLYHAFHGIEAVSGVSLAVEPGEILCLLGPSGCGKTTTLRVAAGLETLQRGRVFVGDRLVAEPGRSVPPERRNVGMVFQDYALFPHLTALENVAFGLTELPAAARQNKATELLARVGLDTHTAQYPHALSGGEQQRVALARALAPSPGVMLLDEPFANLDVRLRNRVRDDSLALLKETGAAMLLVTHDPEEAMLMADRIAVMRKGHIVQSGAPEDLYDHPVDGFMVRFFNDVNVLHGVVEQASVTTSIGHFPAPGLRDGTAVEVLVRPEGLSFDGEDAGSAVEVRSARTMGPYALTQMEVCAGGDHLTARVTGGRPQPGQHATVHVDDTHVFVFPTGPV